MASYDKHVPGISSDIISQAMSALTNIVKDFGRPGPNAGVASSPQLLWNWLVAQLNQAQVIQFVKDYNVQGATAALNLNLGGGRSKKRRSKKKSKRRKSKRRKYKKKQI